MIVAVVLGGFARAYGVRSGASSAAADEQPSGEEKMVDLAADVVYPYEVAPDSSVICFVGNFIGHHNGAVIVCDSAVRYNDRRLECFGNVSINKNQTYIYGDRADYNGIINEAQVYSPLVKVIDGDATLYTYRFRFNTKLNIGEFFDGGVITNRDNLLEAERGYYYADTREVIGVENVEMRNDSYQMTGDSVVYNIENDRARFFTRTNIWNEKDEYIYADRGSYDKDEDRYIITLNGYILTEEQEVWSDSIDYYRDRGYALLRHDIQIDDREHKVLAFGDLGEYWDEPGDALLSRDPAIISYDPEQGDSLFMRADTITMHTRSTLRDIEEARAAAEAAARQAAAPEEELRQTPPSPSDAAKHTPSPATKAETSGSVSNNRDNSDNVPDASADVEGGTTHAAAEPGDLPSESAVRDSLSGDMPAAADSLKMPADSLQMTADSLSSGVKDPFEGLNKEERKALLREMAEKERAEKKKIRDEQRRIRKQELKVKLDSIGELRREKRNLQLDRQQARLDERERKRKARMLARLTRKGIKVKPLDAAALAVVDSTAEAFMRFHDSLLERRLDSLALLMYGDSTAEEFVPDTTVRDTMYRLVRGYRNVRMYRADFQAVCDSVSSSTRDSVIRMYIDPVMWHQANQITSEQTDIHTKNQALDFAEFTGKPMMISKIDTLHYNQVAGKVMYSYFRNNNIYRDDVDGNAQTIYYMQEDDSPEVQGMMYIESGDMTFYIEEQQISGITYRGNPSYILYPMDKIPESQPLFLQGFTWQEERRPSQDSVFKRTIRPSQREVKESLPRPSFPIASRIDAYRAELVSRRRWADRDDTLSQDVIEWLDANTDWREQNARSQAQRNRRMQSR